MPSSIAPGSRVRAGLAVLLTALLVLTGLATGGLSAQAAAGDVSGATLHWGVKQTFRDYINGPAAGHWTVAGGVSDASPFDWAGGSGSYNAAAGTGSVAYPGSIRFVGHETTPGDYALDLTFSNVRVVATGSGAGQLVVDLTSGATTSSDVVFATLDLSGASTGGETVSASAAPATITAAGSTAMQGFYPAGTALDAVTFSWPVEQPAAPTATSTSLGISPATSAQLGADVTLTAQVSPAEAAGAVQFRDGSTALGEPVAVSSGTASLVTDDLAVGSHSITAEFTPSGSGFTGSTSTASSYSITEPDVVVATTTAVAVSPSAPVVAGASVTVTATVTGAGGVTPAGTVQFLSRPASGAADVALGSVALSGGVATLVTTSLPAGGQTFRAVFTPASGFAASTGATTANYGVVNTSEPVVCSPGTGALETTGATARWDYSAYSSDWAKTASGNITLDGQTFVLSGGTVTAGTDCARIAFTGTIRVDAHGFPVDLVDPVLTVSRAGAGSWSAIVRTSATPTATARLTVATISGATGLPALGASGDATVSLAYAGTTAQGTWSAAYSDAWANGFVLQVPSSVRAFYYKSGETAAGARKPPSPLSVSFSWPAVTSTALTVSPAAPVTLGTSTVLTATVTPSTASGTVRFFQTPAGGTEQELGTVSVLAGLAVLPTELAAGGHTFRAEFVPSGSFSASQGTSTANYGVVDTSEPSVCTPDAGAATVSNVTASWAYSAYSAEWTKTASGDISVAGQDFVLKNGVAKVGDDCTQIAFTGSLRVTAYPGFGGYWVELVDPVLTIDADGDGSWAAKVASGTGVAAGPAPTPGAFLTVATMTGATVPSLAGSGTTEVALDFAGTTARGTWNAAYSDAWSNGFVLTAHSMLRAFYFKSGETAAGAKKPPAPIRIGRDAAIATTTTLATSASSAASGTVVTLTAQVTPATAVGSVQFRDGDSVIGTAPLASGTAVLTTGALVVGGHTITAAFVPSDSLLHAPSASSSVAVQIVSKSTPVPSAGSLTWGVKQSFRDYVLGPIASGSISVTGGAGSSAGGYWFPQSSSTVGDSGLGTVGYRGTVTFSGHDGALSVVVGDPRVRITSSTAAVLSVVTASGRVDFAALDLSAATRTVDASGAVRYAGAPAVLTAAGASGFAGFYSAGTALDPVSFTVGSTNTASAAGSSTSAESDDAGDGPADTPPATTGIALDGDAVEGGEVTASADGFEPDETGILVVIYSEPTVLAENATADATGAVTWTGRLPEGLTGEHTLTFQGSVDRGVVLDIAEAESVGCPVEGATLRWGFKESFRAYITGLAAGEWTTSGGASYETPQFAWTETGGDWDGEKTSGLAFAGAVRFTGHEGLLDTTIANPRVLIDGDSGALVLDVSGTTQEGDAVAAEGIAFADLDIAAATREQQGGTIVLGDIPATLTEAGAAAFGTYEAGEALDPVTVEIQGAEACAQPVAAPTDEEAPAAEPVAATSPLGWWLLGGGILLALIITLVVVLAVRRRAA